MNATQSRAAKALSAAAGALALTVCAVTATAHADTNSDFLAALGDAGIGYGDTADTVTLGQSICPLLVQPGQSFASTVAKVRNNGVPPELAAFFAGIAINTYCPQMVSSISDGSVLTELASLQGVNIPGLQIPGLQIPGL